MTVIRNNSISGINSITAQSSALNFYDSTGNTLAISADVTGGVTVATGATISGSTNTITASTNGSERVRIDSSGRVGIGTSIPQTKLDIQGGEVYYHSGTNNNLGVKLTYSNGNSTGIVDTYGNHELEIRTNNSERARFTSNGLKFPSGLY